MPFGVGQWELVVLGVILLLIFGSAKVPRMARDLGKSVRELKETVEGVDPRTPLRELEAPPADDTSRDGSATRSADL
jgi:sec-independent protein translocase protein TatA